VNAPKSPAPAVVSPPTLSSISPNQGSASGGTSVTLTGTGLTTATSIRFGTTNASTFTVLSDTSVVAVAPAGSGAVQVTAVTSGGTSNGLTYTYRSVPTLSSVAPNQGSIVGGTSVTLTGAHFVSAIGVKFGGVAASSFTVVSDTQITATAPPGTAGPVVVSVTTIGGTSNGTAFTYVAAPTLTSVVPNQGPTSGGTSATLTGAQLTTATAVMFGSTTATSFTIVSDSTVVAAAPPATGTVQVTVTTFGGTSNGLSYTAVGSPSI